jgi:hypothetical protein
VSDISDNGTIIGRLYDSALRATAVVWRQASPTAWSSPEVFRIPAGFTDVFLERINAVGDIIGAAYGADSSRSFVWKFRNGEWLNPEPVDIQLPSGASAINDAGALAGSVMPCVWALPNCYAVPAFWPSAGGVRRMLPTLYDTPGRVNGMNNANMIVGAALVHWNGAGVPLAALIEHAVIWFPDSQWPEDLGAIRPSQYGEAVAINNHGWVAGKTYGTFFETYATVWKLPSTPTIGIPQSASRR